MQIATTPSAPPPVPPRLLPQAALSSRQAHKLAQIARLDHFAPGDYLFHVGQPVQALFNIVSGVAKLIAEPPSHRPVVIGFAFSQDRLGQFSPPTYSSSAQAITQLSAYTLPHDRLNHLLTADASLHRRLLNQFCADLRASQAHLLTRRAPPPQRIAAFLLCLRERTAPDPHDPTLLIIPMRRIDIADFLALSTAALRRVLSGFATSQWVQPLSANRIRILNPQALTRLAAGSPPPPPFNPRSDLMINDWPGMITAMDQGVSRLRDAHPDMMKAFSTLAKSAHGGAALDGKTKELIALAIGVATRCEPCIAYHARDAVRAGASRAEIAETLAMAVYMGAGPSAMYAAKALEAYDQLKP